MLVPSPYNVYCNYCGICIIICTKDPAVSSFSQKSIYSTFNFSIPHILIVIFHRRYDWIWHLGKTVTFMWNMLIACSSSFFPFRLTSMIKNECNTGKILQPRQINLLFLLWMTGAWSIRLLRFFLIKKNLLPRWRKSAVVNFGKLTFTIVISLV